MRPAPIEKPSVAPGSNQLVALKKEQPQAARDSFLKTFRQLVLFVVLIVVCVCLPTEQHFVSPPPSPSCRVRSAKSTEPTPAPVAAEDPKLNLSAEMSLSAAPADSAEEELLSDSDTDDEPMISDSNSFLEDAGRFARYLNRQADPGSKFLFLHLSAQEGSSPVAVGKFEAGYGRIFRDNSVIFRGRNGADWEEPGCLYVKACFRF